MTGLEAWTPTRGSWEPSGQHWAWTCPDCGRMDRRAACAVDMTCTGRDSDHEMRVGIRPDAEISGPSALLRELMRLGTVDRISMLQGALTLAQRRAAAQALTDLAEELDNQNRAFVSPAELRELAELHLIGEL